MYKKCVQYDINSVDIATLSCFKAPAYLSYRSHFVWVFAIGIDILTTVLSTFLDN